MFIFCFAARSKVAQNHAQVFKCGDRVGKEDDRIDFPRDSRLEVHGIVSKIQNYRLRALPSFSSPYLPLPLSLSLSLSLLSLASCYYFLCFFSYVFLVCGGGGRKKCLHTYEIRDRGGVTDHISMALLWGSHRWLSFYIPIKKIIIIMDSLCILNFDRIFYAVFFLPKLYSVDKHSTCLGDPNIAIKFT